MITAQNLNWKVSVRDLAALIFEAKTSVRSLHNDLDTVFRIRDAGEGGSSIDIRSASAHTFLDGGLNAYIIKRIYEQHCAVLWPIGATLSIANYQNTGYLLSGNDGINHSQDEKEFVS